jgi:hypothetical protein
MEDEEKREELVALAVGRLPTKKLRMKAEKLLKKLPRERRIRLNEDGQVVYPDGQIGSDLPFLLTWHLARHTQKMERPWDASLFDNLLTPPKKWVKLFE